MDKNQIAVSTYNKIARQYTTHNFDDTSALPYVDNFLSCLPKNAKILDAGSGPGNLVKHALHRGYKAEGVDLSEEMVRIAREKVHEGKFTLMDMRHLDYADTTFDGIISSYSLIHIPSDEIPDTLKEFYRVLRPGGNLLIIVQKGEADHIVNEPFDKKERMFINFFTCARLAKLLSTAGFSIIQQEEVRTSDIHEFAKSDTIIYTIAEKAFY